MAVSEDTAIMSGPESLTNRQQEVLTAALDLMVEVGDGFTMIGVAKRANCSKETLYKWFGDRDGLLTATVQWQAAKVALDPASSENIDRATLQTILETFAARWLKVLTGDVSIALNSLAVSHAASDKSSLGDIVLKNGPFAMAERLKPVIESGRNAGILDYSDLDAAFRTFFGLVVRDVQIRALLGDAISPTLVSIKEDAKRATEQFLTLYQTNQHER